MFLLLVLLLSLSTTLYITLLFYLFFVVCDGFAMAFCPFHSPGFGECAQIHHPGDGVVCVPRSGAPVPPPFRGPGSTHAWPGSFRRRPGRALDPCRPCLPESSGTRCGQHCALRRCCWELPPQTLPGLDEPSAGKPAGGLATPAPPRHGVPPRHPAQGERPLHRADSSGLAAPIPAALPGQTQKSEGRTSDFR